MKIGFIGLGNMGGPMAANLVKAGHSLRGYDPAGVAIPGVEAATSALDAVAGCDAVVTMLPNGEIVRRVYDEITPAAAKGAVMIDSSTIDVDSARHIAAQAEAAQLRPIDAPVSGGVGGAEAGTLTFMVGGSEDAFAASQPLLAVMGKKIVHCGASGAGQAAKICNNMLLGISMIGVCEAFVLADRLGLDRQRLFDVASTSSGSCWSLNTYCPAPGVGPKAPSDNDYKPGFAVELMLKDLKLSQQAAAAAGAPTDMGALATELYARFLEDGGRGKDFSAMIQRLENIARGA